MDCRDVRDELTRRAGRALDPALARHAAECAACARYGERAAAARNSFREHRAGVEPDAGFAARVAARLAERPVDVMGWAAVRLLPATLVLVLVLGWLASGRSPDFAAQETGDITDDLLTWILEGDEEAR